MFKMCSSKFSGSKNVFLYLYMVVKYTLHKSRKNPKNCTSIVLSLIFTPLLVLLLGIFKLYRLLILAILKVVHRHHFHSLADGPASTFLAMETPQSRCIIPVFLLIEHGGDIEEFRQAITSEVRLTFARHKFEKLRCIRKYFAGYNYYLRRQGVPQSCFGTFGTVGEEVTAAEVQELVGGLVNKQLPMDDRGMWDLHIGLSSLVIDDGNKCVALVFRFHHSLGDARMVYNIFCRDFATKRKLSSVAPACDLPATTNRIVVANLEDAFVKHLALAEVPDTSVLHGRQMTGEKITSWFSDDTSKYLGIVREIRKKHWKLTFVDVLLTAASAALHDYAVNKSDCLPKIFTTYTSLQVEQQGNKNFRYGDKEDYVFENGFTLGMVKVPLRAINTCIDDDLLERMKYVRDEYEVVTKKSLDKEFNRWRFNVLHAILPFPITKWLLGKEFLTLMITNLPGCDKFDILDGLPVREFVIFNPNIITSGISMLVSTYNNRLNVSFTFDKSIVDDIFEAQIICHSFLEYLERLNNIV